MTPARAVHIVRMATSSGSRAARSAPSVPRRGCPPCRAGSSGRAGSGCTGVGGAPGYSAACSLFGPPPGLCMAGRQVRSICSRTADYTAGLPPSAAAVPCGCSAARPRGPVQATFRDERCDAHARVTAVTRGLGRGQTCWRLGRSAPGVTGRDSRVAAACSSRSMAGLRRGSPGPGDVTCAAAGASSHPGRRARKIVVEFSDVGQSRILARARCRPGRRAG